MAGETGVAGGFGPFDVERVLKTTEFGGGAGLVEGTPNSQSGRLGEGLDHIVDPDATMTADEKEGIIVRAERVVTADGEESWVDPVTGMAVDDVL
jgi:hypothetical protein